MATKKPKAYEEAEELGEEQYPDEPEVTITIVVPAGSSSPNVLPPSVEGTSQDPNRKEPQ